MDVYKLATEIRDFINNPRKQHILLKDNAKWNMLCSSLDVIEDMEIAIGTYQNHKEPADDGDKYLLLYGILQVLYVQQDAVQHLAESLDIEYSLNNYLKNIRDIRNDSVGHPTKRKHHGQGFTFNFIGRITMSLKGFQLRTTYDVKKSSTFKDVNIFELINTQQKFISIDLLRVLTKIKEEEMKHRKKFRRERLQDSFHKTLGYSFEKIFEAINNGNIINIKFASAGLETISNAIEKFKSALSERGILDVYDSIKCNLELIDYPLIIIQISDFF